ncbi:MAG: carbonic anhydrase family protein [Bacteroidota bacterium]
MTTLFTRSGAILVCALLLAPVSSAQDAPITQTAETQAALTPAEALQMLKDGNERLRTGNAFERDYSAQKAITSGGQYPYAAVITCLDSRIPVEVVFDQGIGDIFVGRVAGNFVDTEMLGSLEFATAAAGAKVIVVMGHTECGAVKGACDNVELGNLTTTLSHIMPAVYMTTDVEGERASSNPEFVQKVADDNVDLNVENIVQRSEVIEGLVEEGRVLVIGAMYDISNGMVTFHDAKMIDAEDMAAVVE